MSHNLVWITLPILLSHKLQTMQVKLTSNISYFKRINMRMDKRNGFDETFVYFSQIKNILGCWKICSFVNYVTLCVSFVQEEV